LNGVKFSHSLSFCLALVLLAACATTAPPVAEVPLSDPLWQVRRGQAVWKPEADQPDIAGDIVLSTHPAGGSSIQFSKTMPILSGRISPAGWSFDLPPEDRHHSGGGDPPARIVWLQLLRALEGKKISERWTLAKPSDLFVALENQHTGERLEVFFEK
jgi:hypothetical protein